MADAGAPTIYDVATVAGVSHQTVSRVLNDPTSVAPTTRHRVLAVIAYLGTNETQKQPSSPQSKETELSHADRPASISCRSGEVTPGSASQDPTPPELPPRAGVVATEGRCMSRAP